MLDAGSQANDPYADNPFWRAAKATRDAYNTAKTIIKEGKEIAASGAAAAALINRNIEAPEINFG